MSQTVSPLEAITDDVKQRDQWLLRDRANDTPKQPHWKGDFYGISWSDPDAWHTFEEALEVSQTRESWEVGYVMAAENDDYPAGTYACIDIDGGVLEDGSLKDWVPDITPFEGTYIEKSTSGTGLHILVDGSKIPDWWSNCQIDEHEGVDVLANKFCVFTGDKTELSGDSIKPINPAPWLFKAYKNIRGTTPDLGESQTQRRAGEEHEEYLTESDIEEALSYVDPDCSHTEWIKLAFAVHDWDSGSKGKRLFEDWSRQGNKYDDAAEDSISWVWTEADGMGVTLGTLIHKAKEGGWTVPKPADSGSGGSNPTPNGGRKPLQEAIDGTWFDEQRQIVKVQRTEEYDSSELVDLFENPDKLSTKETLAVNETPGGAAYLDNPDAWEVEERAPSDPYADCSLQDLKNHALRLIPTNRIAWLPKRQEWFWCDNGGIWHTHGEEYIRQWLDEEFQEHYRSQLRTQVLDQLKARTRAEEDAFGGGPVGTIATKSGLVDLNTGDCREIEAADKVRWRINAEYDPEADCPKWKQFLGDVIEPADIPLLQEYIGYCFRHWDVKHKKALMLLGPTNAGKSVFIDVVEGLFGGEESAGTSSTSVQYLANMRWGPARLVNTALNTRADLGSGLIENTGKVKELIAGDSLDAERKRKPVFQFKPTTKHIFAANRAPARDIDDEAFWDRWLTVIFPKEVPEDDRVGNYDQVLLEESAGILNWGIEGYRRLMEQGKFTNQPHPFENQEKWERYGNSIEQFLERFTEEDPGGFVPKWSTSGDTLGAYSSYREYASAKGLEVETDTKFTQALKKKSHITKKQRTVDNSREWGYSGISLTDDAPQPQSASSDDDEPAGTGLGEYQ